MPWSVRNYRLQDVAKSVRCKASSRNTACTVIGNHLVVFLATSGKHIDRAYVVKPVLESSRSYDDRLIVAEKSNDSTGSHEPTHGQPACSVHARGPHHSTHGKPACSVHARCPHHLSHGQPVCSVHARGPHHSSHGLPACSVHATGSTTGKSRTTYVEPTHNGSHTNQSTDYLRAAFTLRGSHKSSEELPTRRRATESTIVKPRTTHVERKLQGLQDTLAH